MTTAGEGTAVRVADLKKRYGDLWAVDGISFDVAPGEVFGLLGHNGAGKSTTLRILTGRARPTEGTAEVLGSDVTKDLEVIRGRINLVSEDPTVYGRMSARENLEFFCRLYGLPRKRAKEVLERVRLVGTKGRKAKDFSTGMRQRLLLARALLNKPEVLFLDEPTRGLDPASARDLRDIVRDLAADGAAVIITTHDMAEADELSDRVAFLADGKIVALDTPRALKAEGDTGSREVEVELADGRREAVTLGQDGSSAELQRLLSAGGVRTVHSREKTLADVFIAVAGPPPDDLTTEDDR